MDIKINNQTFLVCGATSGFGKGTAMALMNEGAKVIGVARSKDKLDSMVASFGSQFVAVQGDITESETIKKVTLLAKEHQLSGALINAGGPPALSFEETNIENWDDAYKKSYCVGR
jgi:3-oxoacyl-[acyl-carrier protein] reductase